MTTDRCYQRARSRPEALAELRDCSGTQFNPPVVEAFIAALEAEVAELKRKMAEPQRDWRRTIGAFSGDDGMKELFQDALKLREADRAKTRPGRKQRKAKR